MPCSTPPASGSAPCRSRRTSCCSLATTDQPFLRDVLGPGLVALLVGFNPSPRSAAVRCHYAGRGNQFWRLLAAAGLTPRLLRAEEGPLLPQWGLGLTNLVARPTVSAAQLSLAELRAGGRSLRAAGEAHAPRIVAYTGKGVYVGAGGRPD